MNFQPQLRQPNFDGRYKKRLSDHRLGYFAQSVLWHTPMADKGTPPLLPEDQARDVLKWAGQLNA
jgi:hypothetical protein